MHADMGLQFPLNIPNDVLDVRRACFPDLSGHVVTFKAVLQKTFFDQEGIQASPGQPPQDLRISRIQQP